jgi:predicted phosphodiesterase
MRALVLSDIHGNLEALAAVLHAAGEYDQLWNLGDVVGYGGSPNQVIDVIEPIANLNVRGNHDRVCCGAESALGFNPVARAAALWTLKELTPAHIEWLRDMPQGPVTPYQNGNPKLAESMNVTCVHGSPLNEDQYILSMRDAWAPLQQMAVDATFFGHTHVQGGFSRVGNHWREIHPAFRTRKGLESWTMAMPTGTHHLVNPGSVGQPRDADWRAAFAIYESGSGPETEQVTYHRVPYDLTMSQGKILMAGLPERLAVRLREGR